MCPCRSAVCLRSAQVATGVDAKNAVYSFDLDRNLLHCGDNAKPGSSNWGTPSLCQSSYTTETPKGGGGGGGEVIMAIKTSSTDRLIKGKDRGARPNDKGKRIVEERERGYRHFLVLFYAVEILSMGWRKSEGRSFSALDADVLYHLAESNFSRVERVIDLDFLEFFDRAQSLRGNL